MRLTPFSVLIILIFTSCKDIVEHHLEQGLFELENSRIVEKSIIEGYEIHSVGFFKNDDGTQKIAIRLNSDISQEVISKYTFGFHIKLKKSENSNPIEMKRKYLSFSFVPKLYTIGEYKYIIHDYQIKSKDIKSIRFFIYNLGKYKIKYGNDVFVKNIKLD